MFSQLGLIDNYHGGLGSPDSTLHAVMLADIRRNYPLVTLLVLVALQSAPDDLYEAVRSDGTSAWGRFCAITFPTIADPLGVALVLRTIDASGVFGIIYTMARGGPLDSIETLSFFVYQGSFNYLRAGSGAACAMLMSLMCAVLIVLHLFSLLRQWLQSVDDGA